jgi:hypothetical protein
MNMYEEDALDRALLALPLEEPPAGLRASILMATAYRPALASVAQRHSFWELAFMGALAAVAVWLVALVAMGGGSLFVHTLAAIGATLTRVFSNGPTLAWLAAGTVTAVWLTLFTGSQPFVLATQRFGRRTGR